MIEHQETENDFSAGISIKDRYKATDVMFMHLFNISRLSDHVITVAGNGNNPNVHNYKNMVDMLMMFMSNDIDEIASKELKELEAEYESKPKSDVVTIKYSTKKIGIFIRLISRCGMWFIGEVSDEL